MPLSRIGTAVQGDGLSAIAVADGGQEVVLGTTWDRRVRLIDTTTHRLIAAALTPHERGARVAAFAPTEPTIAIGSGAHHDRSHDLLLWAWQDPATPLDLPTTSAEIGWVAFRGDGRYLAAMGRSSTIVVVDVSTAATTWQGMGRLTEAPHWRDEALVFLTAAGPQAFLPHEHRLRDATPREVGTRWDRRHRIDHRGAWESAARPVIRIVGTMLVIVSGDSEHPVESPCAFASGCVSGDGRTIAVTAPDNLIHVFTL